MPTQLIAKGRHRHNELHYGVDDLVNKAFVPFHVHNNPLVFNGCVIQGVRTRLAVQKLGNPEKANNPPQVSEDLENKGCLIIRDLCHNSADRIHHMRAVNNGESSYIHGTPEKCLQMVEKEKEEIIWMQTYINNIIYRLLTVQFMASWGWRPRLH